jgi:uncharacterized membrane protein
VSQTRELIRDEILRFESHSGPLPSPTTLARYEEILPGAAHRILVMAEAQATHRMEMESRALAGEQRRSERGLYAAFGVSILSLVAGTWMVLANHEVAGLTVLGANLTTLAGLFIYGTERRRSERKERRQALAAPQRIPPPT